MAVSISFLFFFSALLISSFSEALPLLKKQQIQQFSLKNKFFSVFEKQFLQFVSFENTLVQLYLSKLVLSLTAVAFLAKSPFWLILSVLFIFFILTYCSYSASRLWPEKTFKLTASLASFSFYLLYPITVVFSALYAKVNRQAQKQAENRIKNRLQHLMMRDYDEKLLTSLSTFHEKEAREVMVPRINIFALPLNTSIKEAAQTILKEDYSRIPVYQEDLDNIVGFFMYKDLLKIFTEAEKTPSLLNEPVEILLKPVIYSPENKKISFLFQDFKKKQCHLAIVVNEYGNTEGLITTEDILEELVGEIKDEYDFEEEEGFWKLPGGGYIVDAKISIIDLEKKIGIRIPHSPEYETIGGFLFHKAGTIPQKGWSLYLDEFEIEVLISSERHLEKLRLTPLLEKKEKIAKE